MNLEIPIPVETSEEVPDEEADTFTRVDSPSLTFHPLAQTLLKKTTELRELQNQEVLLPKDDNRIKILEEEIRQIKQQFNIEASWKEN